MDIKVSFSVNADIMNSNSAMKDSLSSKMFAIFVMCSDSADLTLHPHFLI